MPLLADNPLPTEINPIILPSAGEAQASHAGEQLAEE
jgi:hypothetical protein